MLIIVVIILAHATGTSVYAVLGRALPQAVGRRRLFAAGTRVYVQVSPREIWGGQMTLRRVSVLVFRISCWYNSTIIAYLVIYRRGNGQRAL